MSEEIDGAVKKLMKQLMETTAESFDLAFARYETSERETALAHARRLLESQDPAEQELGKRLQAEVLKVERHPASLVLDVSGANGGPVDPLLRSPSPSLPAADTSLPAPEATSPPPRKRGRPSKEELALRNQQPRPEEKPGPGRPRKS